MVPVTTVSYLIFSDCNYCNINAVAGKGRANFFINIHYFSVVQQRTVTAYSMFIFTLIFLI